MSVALWWIRRDLRLADNPALSTALDEGESVVPVFILDPALLSSSYVGEKRLAFLFQGLRDLGKSLQERGSYLVLRRGQPLEQLSKLFQELGASKIFAERNFSPYALQRDKQVSQHLPLRLVDGLTVFPPEAVHKADGTPYTVYTPFRRRWSEILVPGSEALLPKPEIIPTPAEISSLSLPERPSLSAESPFVPGEAEAQRRLKAFMGEKRTGPIADYADSRNRMDLLATSGLSPYLRFGMISVRQALIEAQQGQAALPAGASQSGWEAWINELIWREFYMSILFHFPKVAKGSFRPVYDNIHWQNDLAQFEAWCQGLTGFPVVDAAMRQLSHSGWMHNRARMITASFLVKDLLIDWRWGERWFMQQLLDGDLAANNGGWQWTAGTGTDAAPYFRIFNPVLQGKKFDPHGNYVKRWLPELEPVPIKYIQEPWKMPASLQKEIGCVIGRHYPKPIVDHSQARQRTLAAYAQAREGLT